MTPRHVLLPLGAAALALLHPTLAEPDVAAALATRTGPWLGIHASLLLILAVLTRQLTPDSGTHAPRSTSPRADAGRGVGSQRRPARQFSGIAPADLTRWTWLLFAVLNTAYVSLDGLAIGVLAKRDAAAANALWSAPPLTALANAVGASWAAASLLTAATRLPLRRGRDPLTQGLLVLTWLTFLASALGPLGIPLLGSRLTATLTAALLVYQCGTASLSAALLVLAAVFRLHVGPEAAVGLLLVAAAEATQTRGGQRTIKP